MITEIRTRRFNIGDILKASWYVYRSQFLKIVAMTLCVILPAQAINFLFPWDASSSGFQTPLTVNDIKALVIAALIRFIVFNLFLFYFASLTHLFEKKILEEEIDWESALSNGLSRFGSVLLTEILATLLIQALALLLIVPAVIYGNYFSFYFQAAVLRNCNVIEALKYSKNLVIGQWWRVFAIWLVLLSIQGIVLYAYAFLGRFLLALPIVLVIYHSFKSILLAFTVAESVVFFLNLDFLHRLSTDHTQPALVPTLPDQSG